MIRTNQRPVFRSHDQCPPIRGQYCLPVHSTEESVTPTGEASEAELLFADETAILLLLGVLLLLVLLVLFRANSCSCAICRGKRLSCGISCGLDDLALLLLGLLQAEAGQGGLCNRLSLYSAGLCALFLSSLLKIGFILKYTSIHGL